MIDNLDLTEAHTKFRDNMLKLNECLKKEQIAEATYLDKENKVRISEFVRLCSNEITKGIYDEIIKNDCFAEKVDWKKCVTSRKIAENEVRGAQENLNVIKLRIRQ